MKTTGIVTWFNDAKGYGGIREMHQSDSNTKVINDQAPILSGEGFSEFWKTCPELPWFKAMQKFHKAKANA